MREAGVHDDYQEVGEDLGGGNSWWWMCVSDPFRQWRKRFCARRYYEVLDCFLFVIERLSRAQSICNGSPMPQ